MSLDIFLAEFIRTVNYRSPGKAESVRVVTVVRRSMTIERSSLFRVKKVILSVTAPGDTDLSDATDGES